jgi:hypothetical protein
MVAVYARDEEADDSSSGGSKCGSKKNNGYVSIGSTERAEGGDATTPQWKKRVGVVASPATTLKLCVYAVNANEQAKPPELLGACSVAVALIASAPNRSMTIELKRRPSVGSDGAATEAKKKATLTVVATMTSAPDGAKAAQRAKAAPEPAIAEE